MYKFTQQIDSSCQYLEKCIAAQGKFSLVSKDGIAIVWKWRN